MTEYTVAGAVLLAVVFFAAGWWARGWYSRARLKKPWKDKRKFETSTRWLSPEVNHQLRFLSIEGDKALAICARIARGGSMTYRSTTGRGKILSRDEFTRLRRELVNHQFCKRTRAGGISPTPEGRRQAQNILIRARAARLHITKQEKKGPGWIFGKWVSEEIKNNFR